MDSLFSLNTVNWLRTLHFTWYFYLEYEVPETQRIQEVTWSLWGCMHNIFIFSIPHWSDQLDFYYYLLFLGGEGNDVYNFIGKKLALVKFFLKTTKYIEYYLQLYELGPAELLPHFCCWLLLQVWLSKIKCRRT